MASFQNANLLVVDDDVGICETVAAGFEGEGFNVHRALDGQEALEIVKNHSIDLVLSDISMPKMDGIQLLKEIKALNPKLPIVMFHTAHLPVTLAEVYQSGVEAVFVKPATWDVLFETVSAAVSKSILRKAIEGRRHSRVDIPATIRLATQGREGLIQSRVVNLSPGGCFISFNPGEAGLGPNSVASFELTFDGDPFHAITGSGVVRWVREEENEMQPRGCGLEFVEISEPDYGKMIEWINWTKTKARFRG